MGRKNGISSECCQGVGHRCAHTHKKPILSNGNQYLNKIPEHFRWGSVTTKTEKRLAEECLSEVEVSQIIKLAVSTLRKNRCIGVNHPPYRKLGSKVVYLRSEVETWVKSHKRCDEVR